MEKIGSGSYGIIYRDGDTAIKRCFYSGPSVWMSNLREMDILHKFKGHPNIVNLRDIKTSNTVKDGEGKTIDKISLVMDYMPASLQNATPVKGFDLDKVRKIMVQILLALEYIHIKRVIHRDLKPDNILYNPETTEVRICDFGMSDILMNYSPSERDVTSFVYRAPEVFSNRRYSCGIDIWAAGCVMYYLLTGNNLFNLEHKIPSKEMLELQKNVNIKKIFKINHDFRYLLENLLKIDPRERISATQALKSRFFDPVREAYILPTKQKYPPLNITLGSVFIENIPERIWMREITDNFIKRFETDDYVIYPTIFHGLEIFDRYLSWAKLNQPSLPPQEDNGKYISKQETFLYLYTCFYISHKYYSVISLPISIIHFFPPELTRDEYFSKAEEFEEFIIKEVLGYSIFKLTLYEIAEDYIENPTPKDYLNILNIYLSIRKWKNLSYRKMFSECMGSKLSSS